MIQAISPDAANHVLHKCILPRTSRGSEHLFDPHAFNPPLELAPVDRISLPQEILRRRVPRESLNDLLTGPLGSRMLRDIEVHYPATMVCENHQDEQYLESYGGYHEEIDRH